jgi:PAS domain S-box-containing protein
MSCALGTELTAVHELSPVGDSLLLRSGAGWPAGLIGVALIPVLAGRLGAHVLEAAGPISEEDLRLERRAVPRSVLSEYGVVSGATAPVIDGLGPFGAVAAYSTVSRDFSEDELDFIRRVGEVLSAAVARRRSEDLADGVRSGAEEQFRQLFAASPDAMVLIDPHDPETSWPIVDCNEAACRMNGYAREDLVGRSIDALNLTKGTEDERIAYLTNLRRMGVISLETYHRHRDGHVIPVEVSTSIVELGGRELVLGVDRDITVRKKAQEELRASYEALRRSDDERRRLLAGLLAAHEDERLRLADDIHDDSVQVLTAVSFRLASLRPRLDPDAEPVLRQLEELVERAIQRQRNLMFELRPASLYRVGLAAGVREYVERMTAEGDPAVEVEGTLEREPLPEARILLYRLAQEALTNVRKHAQARHARVLLAREGEGILVRVEDDGIGFDPKRAPSRSPGRVGLISLRERAELAGGWFDLESAPREGTIVSFWIPDSPAGAGRSLLHGNGNRPAPA